MTTSAADPLLEHLQRVALPHVERGLALAGDPALVRSLLAQLALPDAPARVAFTLGEDGRGPSVVVDREGRLLVCVGEGAKPGSALVVPRARLDGLLRRQPDLRARLAAARVFGGLGKLLLRLYHAGEDLAREEVREAVQVAPLFRGALAEALLVALRSTVSVHPLIAGVVRRTEKPRAHWTSALSDYYHSLWFALHAGVLLGSDPRALRGAVDDETLRRIAIATAQAFFAHAAESHIARAVWMAGRLGRRLFEHHQRAFAAADGVLALTQAALALGSTGHRSPRRRAAARAALANPPAWAATPLHKAWADGVFALLDRSFTEADEFTATLRRAGTKRALLWSPAWPLTTPYHATRAEDVSDAFAFALAITGTYSFLTDFKRALPIFVGLPWLSRASAEELYLPGAHIAAAHVPWTPECTLQLFRPVEKRLKEARSQKEEGPTRSGPCPCGSGKKYKRCCGAA